MHKLTVTLKQHTPLIHFQHDQEGATLRASEVKPKLDKYILTKLGGDDGYEAGIKMAKDNGWLVGKGEHPALDYKMRVKSSNPQSIVLNVHPKIDNKTKQQKKDELGNPLFTTSNYPNNLNSMIMGNMEGRVKSELLNFKIYNEVQLVFLSKSNSLIELIMKNENICDFFVDNNMGNRTSKGFGSYTVSSINGTSVNHKSKGDWEVSFSIDAGDGDISEKKAYEDVFYAINRMWKALKKYSGAPKNSLESVFLARESSISNEERIPSPVIFKPIVLSKERNTWNVKILAILNQEVIDSANSDIDDFYDLIDEAVSKAKKFSNQSFSNNYIFENIKMS